MTTQRKIFSTNDIQGISTLGELSAAGYMPISVKEELRDNLIARLRSGAAPFEGILGYEETVIPEIERAILSRHNILLLGLRGQAKTRIARQMVKLLDEYIPVISGSDINDDPLQPLSYFGRKTVEEMGESTPISWLHRDERFGEKLATPDVTVADLIGDIDPIKAAAQKLSYSDERVLHFGLIPRCHRSIFVINELPDLQARIQVALFNILQEGDIQIRGFKLRFPLDIQFVFTANPEDYTNRGSIVTPLKDRIESQILTHYPKSLAISKSITEQEAQPHAHQRERVKVDELPRNLLERIAMTARESEFVDEKSGVSARLTISAMETLFSAAERRALINREEFAQVRISDFNAILPAITGKIELVYEGEQEGPAQVARHLLDKAIRKEFLQYFPDPAKFKKLQGESPYKMLVRWFEEGNTLDFPVDMPEQAYQDKLDKVPYLRKMVSQLLPKGAKGNLYLWMEFVLHGMAAHSLISKFPLEAVVQFGDITSGMLNLSDEDDEDEEGRDALRDLFN
jgi:magnesium chelatase subunit I